MVLLNGIKYACERCIRGHRVSSCTHTDKLLVMIKPKGRPASQCSHCREQRKVKNAHTLCNCGKKGKSPGQHLASCLCHKNSHCTCVSKEKKAGSLAPKSLSTPEITALESGDATQSEASQSVSDFLKPGPPPPVSMTTQDLDFLIEDIALPFETDNGLLDYFSSLRQYLRDTPDEQFTGDTQFQRSSGEPQQSHTNNGNFADGSQESLQQGDSQFMGGYSSSRTPYQAQLGQLAQDVKYFPQPPSDADLDLMENMYPLFPLVGFHSFEDDKSLPLLGLPEESSHSESSPNSNPRANRHSLPHTEFSGAMKSDSPPQIPSRHRSSSAQYGNSGVYSNLHSSHQSSVSLSNMNNGPTHHPRPLKPSSSFSVGYLSNRPRRPESVLSAASTSSNTSKQNVLDSSQTGLHNFPKAQNSAAFPPFTLSNNNSTDDFHNFNSPGFFNENRLLPILSDEEAPKAVQRSVNATPSMPSRQLLQTRRKTSLSRSHLQLHHNVVSKEHTLLPVKAGSSSENSPRQALERRFGSYDEILTPKSKELDSYLREVTEESVAYLPSENNTGVHDSALGRTNDDFNIDNPEFSLIPMYLEIFEPIQNGN